MAKVTFPGTVDAAARLVLTLAGAICMLPAVIMLGGAFFEEGRPSLCHVLHLFHDPGRMAELAANSAIVTGGALMLSLPLGACIGLLCFRTDMPLRKLFVPGCLLAACIPLHVTAAAWMALTGLPFWMYRAWGAAWIKGVAYTPLVALVTGVCFAAGNRQLEDIKSLEGGRARVVRHAVLPAGAWGLAAAALTVTVLSLWDIAVTDVLMIRTFAEEVFTQFQLGAGSAAAGALALPAALLLIPPAAALAWCLRRYGPAAVAVQADPPRAIPLGRLRFPLAAGLVLAAAVLAGVPLFSLLRAAGGVSDLRRAWHTAGPELAATLRVTPAAASLSVILALPAAWVLVRSRRGRALILPALLLLLSVPAPVIGVGIIRLLNHDGPAGWLYDSPAALILAYVARTLPFTVAALVPGIARVPADLEEAAALDGSGWARTLYGLVLPLCWRAVAVAWLLAFVLALAEMGASFLVAPPGLPTLNTRFFTLIHYGVYPDAAGICLLLLLIVGAAAGGMAALLRPLVRRRLP